LRVNKYFSIKKGHVKQSTVSSPKLQQSPEFSNK